MSATVPDNHLAPAASELERAFANHSIPSSVEGTPSLAPASDPSPVFEELLSPSIEAADKAFELDAPSLPECWGHRGASASFPENTKQSFIEACKAGADGIETDIREYSALPSLAPRFLPILSALLLASITPPALPLASITPPASHKSPSLHPSS